MSRPKGTPKTGGRVKGTPNKATTDIKTWVADILDSGRMDFERRLTKLDDREYIRTFVGLLGYVIPKMSPITPEAALEQEYRQLERLIDTMPDEVIDRVTEKLLELQKAKQKQN